MEILAVENLSFTYPGCTDKALDNVSFSVESGEFVAVCGATGSGKSTLLRMLKRELTPQGELSGKVRYRGTPLAELDAATSACKIGFVMQRPEQQIVTDRVWHELAFVLENMGLPTGVIRRRVSEMSSYFGIEDWFDKPVSELSGGQKQLLNLAAVMVMQPELLILDEPTAQLDPIAASEFIAALVKLNRELGLTVIIVEHRLEEVVPASDKLLVMENGRLTLSGEPRRIASEFSGRPELLESMPAAVRLCSRVSDLPIEPDVCPLTVREGRDFVTSRFRAGEVLPPEPEDEQAGAPALEFREVYFRYGRNMPDVLRGLNMTVREGELFCLLGGNGSGKSTALAAASGLITPYSGEIRVFGKKLREYKNRSLYRECLALLPQDVQTMFLHPTVRRELEEVGAKPEDLPFDLSHLLDKHPYDLSGGEAQLAALAKVLASRPRLLLLDEPTKGIDAHARGIIVELLRRLARSGMTIVVVTHDIEFAAECGGRCALFFRGEITSCGRPRRFFAENSFYTTAINRMTRGHFTGAVTLGDAEELCRRSFIPASAAERGERPTHDGMPAASKGERTANTQGAGRSAASGAEKGTLSTAGDSVKSGIGGASSAVGAAQSSAKKGEPAAGVALSTSGGAKSATGGSPPVTDSTLSVDGTAKSSTKKGEPAAAAASPYAGGDSTAAGAAKPDAMRAAAHTSPADTRGDAP